MARPNLKFLNSTIVLPPLSWVNQVESLPAPLPIRIPFALRERGKWGKIDIQKERRVMSDLREERFTESFKRKIRLAEMRKGLFKSSPMVPKRILVSARWVARLSFCLVLNLNFRGWRIIFTLKESLLFVSLKYCVTNTNRVYYKIYYKRFKLRVKKQ